MVEQRSRTPSCVPAGRWWAPAVLAVLVGLGATPALAQNGDGAPSSAAADSASDEDAGAARIARADSIRASLRQPPGSHGGLTAMDVIRAPFELVSGTMALALMAGVGVYEILDETGALDARLFLAGYDLHVDPDFIGSGSWPALVATYRGLDPLFLQAGYSLRHYELYGGGLSLGDEEAGAEIAGRYHLMRELDFWGVGPGTVAGDRSDYALTRTEAGGSAWGPLIGPLGLRAGVAWERNDVDRGFDSGRPDLQDTFDPDALAGAARTTDFLRGDVELDLDLTDVWHLHPRGLRLLGSYHAYRGVNGTGASFARAALDARGYVPVNRRQAFAVRVLAEDRLDDAGGEVPFTHLALLGDDHGLRGYGSRRFVDRALLAGQAEWRYEVWWHPGNPDLRVEGFAFADYATVAPSLSKVEAGDFELTPGIGMRFRRGGIGLGEAFLAFGGEAPRVDVSLGVTF